MSPDWHGWVRRHAAVFGVIDDGFIEILLTWAALFAANGRTPGQLVAATDRMFALSLGSLGVLPKYRADHLAGLEDALRMIDRERFVRQSQADEQPGGQHPCLWCEGTGLVTVPRLDCTRKGRHLTCAVTCRCDKGAWLYGRLNERVPHLWTLDRYERQNPDWWRQMRARQDIARAECEAHGLDKVLGALCRRLRMPPGEEMQ